MDDTFQFFIDLGDDIKLFFNDLGKFVFKNLHLSFLKFENRKGVLVSALYKQRGKLSRKITHYGMGSLVALGVMISPVIAQELPAGRTNPWDVPTQTVLSASTDNPGIDTLVSEKIRDKIYEYTVAPGDTVASIAEKFGVSVETIRWQNSLVKDKIKVGQTLQILPVTGVVHKVQKGDTVYSIAKRYDSESQAIIDFPFNTFSNDETFELAIGQLVIVPDGVMPTEAGPITPRIRQITPDAGTVVASGQFVWPTQGTITQRYSWYHPGIDIANRSLPSVVAADSGSVVYAGWDSAGYGNMVLIDHGNGFRTRYAHLSQIFVISGQSVGRGSTVGKMGSTGRSTGPHTHFEIILNGVHVNPFNYLK